MHFAIFQTWGLGDLAMTTPVISEFRRVHPHAKLTLIVGGPAQAALLENSPLIDQILPIPAQASPLKLLRFLFSLRHQRIDVAFIGTRIWMDGMIPWGLKFLSGIHTIIGDSGQRRFRYPYSVCNTIDPGEHRVDRMLHTFALWSRQRPSTPRFAVQCSPAGLREAGSVLAGKGLVPGQFILVHPGSADAPKQREKRIPVGVALRVAGEILDRRHDLSIAFIFGPDDAELLAHFQRLRPRQVVITGSSLPTTLAIISQALGFIGSDSGLGHIAAALEVPTITLIGPTVRSETAPYGARSTTIQRREKLACQPCWGGPHYGRCPYGVRCMHELPEADVVAQAVSWRTE